MFAVAFVVNGSGGHPGVWFSPVGPALAGLFRLAAHLSGFESAPRPAPTVGP